MDGSLTPLPSLFILSNQEIGEKMTKTLPKDFIFGGATAAYQAEGLRIQMVKVLLPGTNT